MKQGRILVSLICTLAFVSCSHSGDGGPPQSSISPLQLCQIKTVVDSYPSTTDKLQSPEVSPTALVSLKDMAWVVATVKPIPGVQGSLEHGIIRKTTNGGSSWSVIDDSTGPKQLGAENTAIALGANQSIYVSQNFIDGPSTSVNLHYSTDSEKTWKDVSYTDNQSGKLKAPSLTIASDQTVYMAVVSELNGKKKSSLLKLNKDQSQFVLVDSIDNAEIKQILAKQDGSVLEVGALFDDKDSSTWFVREGGVLMNSTFPATLSDGDKGVLARLFPALKVKPTPPLQGAATAVYIDANNILYIAGEVNDGKIKSWTVRESGDNGQSFYVTDAYHFGMHRDVVPRAFFDYQGRTALVGGSHDVEGVGRWNLRVKIIIPTPRYHAKWFELSSIKFAKSADDNSQGVGAFTNSSGEVVVVGDAKDDSGIRSLKTVNIKPCPPKKKP